MKQGWWVAGVGLVGVVLAILLFPRPDTGEDIPDGDPNRPHATSEFKTTKQAGTGVVRGGGRPAPDGEKASEEPWQPSPELLAQREWRSRPAATYASKVLAPFSAIRFSLMKMGTPEARALADDLGTGVMAELRGVRSATEEDPLTGMKPQLDLAIGKVSEGQFGKDPVIEKHVARYKELMAEYASIVAGAPMPSGPEPKLPPGNDDIPPPMPADPEEEEPQEH